MQLFIKPRGFLPTINVEMRKILIIEDEPQMRRNLATILGLENYAVIVAEDGVGGVELARAESPDLILCDVMMPGQDGYGVLQQLRSEARTAMIPFIFLTAKGEKTDQRAGMNLGADDYLAKPVSTDDLLAAITARLQREESRARREMRPDLSSPVPLQALGLTPREAEVLFWVAQGKTNPEIAVILDCRPRTVKKHLEHIFPKLGVETRTSATRTALETLSV
jgi:DNA-binding NarL/FixJ family response regulator